MISKNVIFHMEEVFKDSLNKRNPRLKVLNHNILGIKRPRKVNERECLSIRFLLRVLQVVRMIQRLLQFDIASESSVLSGVTFGSSNEGLPLLESSVYHCCWACVFHSHGPSLSGCPLSKIGYSSDGSQKLLGQRCVEIGPSSSI